MNTSNENPAKNDDLSYRLLDIGLSELIGGAAPPDLSSRIAAATFRQTAAVAQVPRTRQDRAFWVNLAIAVMLLIGVTIVLLPQVRSGGQQSRVAAKGSSVQGAAKADRLGDVQDLPRSIVVTDAYGLGDPTPPIPTPKLSLGLSQMHHTGAPAQAGSRPAGPEGGPQPVGLYALSPSAGRGLQPAEGRHGLDISGPNFGSAIVGDGRIEALKAVAPPAESFGDRYAAHDVKLLVESEVPGFTSNNTLATGLKQGMHRYWRRDGVAGTTQDGTGPDLSGDQYTRIVENPFIKAEGGAAVSTFSIDVDTASYSNVRQFLMDMNQLPPPDAVRIEELINYFQYGYEGPKQTDEAPFAAHVEVTGCPWAPEHRLARIGIKGRELDRSKRPQSNLVFLVDVSGSMDEPNKLPLVIYGLEQLTRELGENDRVAIVVYASSEGLVLPSTRGDKQDTILAALAKLKAGGSTAGGAGIQLAYQLAEDHFIKGGTNRVILCTDGDFNVGVTSTADLQRLVEKKAKDTGVFLSVLGFGRGNLNDTMMEAISNHGNGNYHYVDNRSEARRVLVEQMTGTLITIAKDVKIQVEFNPTQVAGYRLIGYEDRMLRTEDFNDDKKDAGEIGAGHTVTALYEIVPTGKAVDVTAVDELKYQKPEHKLLEPYDPKKVKPSDVEYGAASKELLTLKMRYKAPDGDTSKKLEWPVTDDGKSFSAASGDLKFAASVAGFGLLLRNSQYKGNLTYAATLELAQDGIGDDSHGYRKEFLDMVRKAKELRHE